MEKVVSLDSTHTGASEELTKVKYLSKHYPQQRSENISLRMGRSLLHLDSQRKRLTGVRGTCVLFFRSLIDVVGNVFGAKLYTEDDYEYY